MVAMMTRRWLTRSGGTNAQTNHQTSVTGRNSHRVAVAAAIAITRQLRLNADTTKP